MRSFIKSHRRNSSEKDNSQQMQVVDTITSIKPPPMTSTSNGGHKRSSSNNSINTSPMLSSKPMFSSSDVTMSPGKKSRNRLKNFLKQKVSTSNLNQQFSGSHPPPPSTSQHQAVSNSIHGSPDSPEPLQHQYGFYRVNTGGSSSGAGIGGTEGSVRLSSHLPSSTINSPTIIGTKTHEWGTAPKKKTKTIVINTNNSQLGLGVNNTGNKKGSPLANSNSPSTPLTGSLETGLGLNLLPAAPIYGSFSSSSVPGSPQKIAYAEHQYQFQGLQNIQQQQQIQHYTPNNPQGRIASTSSFSQAAGSSPLSLPENRYRIPNSGSTGSLNLLSSHHALHSLSHSHPHQPLPPFPPLPSHQNQQLLQQQHVPGATSDSGDLDIIKATGGINYPVSQSISRPTRSSRGSGSTDDELHYMGDVSPGFKSNFRNESFEAGSNSSSGKRSESISGLSPVSGPMALGASKKSSLASSSSGPAPVGNLAMDTTSPIYGQVSAVSNEAIDLAKRKLSGGAVRRSSASSLHRIVPDETDSTLEENYAVNSRPACEVLGRTVVPDNRAKANDIILFNNQIFESSSENDNDDNDEDENVDENDDDGSSASSKSSRFSFVGRNTSMKYYKSEAQLEREELSKNKKDNHEHFNRFINNMESLQELEDDMNYVDFDAKDDTDDLFNRNMFSISDDEDEAKGETNGNGINDDVDDNYDYNNGNNAYIFDDDGNGDDDDIGDYADEVNGFEDEYSDYEDEINKYQDEIEDYEDDLNSHDGEDKAIAGGLDEQGGSPIDGIGENDIIKNTSTNGTAEDKMENSSGNYISRNVESSHEGINSVPAPSTGESRQRDSIQSTDLLKPGGEYRFSSSDQDVSLHSLSPGLLPSHNSTVDSEISLSPTLEQRGIEQTPPPAPNASTVKKDVVKPQPALSLASDIHNLLSMLSGPRVVNSESKASIFSSNSTLKELSSRPDNFNVESTKPSHVSEMASTRSNRSSNNVDMSNQPVEEQRAERQHLKPIPSVRKKSEEAHVPASVSQVNSVTGSRGSQTYLINGLNKQSSLNYHQLRTNGSDSNGNEDELSFLSKRYSWLPNDDKDSENLNARLKSLGIQDSIEEKADNKLVSFEADSMSPINQNTQNVDSNINNNDDGDDDSYDFDIYGNSSNNNYDQFDDSMLEEVNQVPEDLDFDEQVWDEPQLMDNNYGPMVAGYVSCYGELFIE
ncbi:unnamed protein product [Ambrosiozyma monospora]|uniref:Unnamed protein product n=1 Tax=Ambrosiozyma monospora TaxID=43982 RepID=A0A9W7DG32_AMBMO|nr:unnamed protein product [Ambrosiozyma monospora]